MILCLETATSTCSVALNDGSRTLALRECKGQNAHSEKITIFIKEDYGIYLSFIFFNPSNSIFYSFTF